MFVCPGDGGPTLFATQVCDGNIDCVPGGQDEVSCTN